MNSFGMSGEYFTLQTPTLLNWHVYCESCIVKLEVN